MEESTSIAAQVAAVLGDFSPTALMEVWAEGLGIAVPLVAAWFAMRWIWNKAKGALKQGK